MKLLPENKREWQNALFFAVTFPIFLIEGLIWCIIFGILNIGPYTEYCFIRLIGLWWVTLPLEVILLVMSIIFFIDRRKLAILGIILFVLSVALGVFTPHVTFGY